MQPRYVVRPPSILTTPRALANQFGCTTRNGRNQQTFSFTRDFFLYYPHPSKMVDINAEEYRELHTFTRATKPAQRALLHNYRIPTPETYNSKSSGEVATVTSGRPGYIVRPLRHSGGVSYRITQDRNDFIEGQEYISRIFPKSFEYRIITCFGEVICTLLKVPPADARPEDAWNHNNGSHFTTVNNPLNNRLRFTSVYEDCLRVPIIKQAHLCGIDVLLAKDPWRYVICELNFCPSLTIETNLQKVISHVQNI